MDVKKTAAGLHPLERKVLPALAKHSAIDALAQAAGLKDVEVVRALQWLENKKLVTVAVEPRDVVLLEANGRAYQKKGLPERHFLQALGGKELSLEQLAKKSGLSREELNACIGVLRSKGLVLLRKDKSLMIKPTPQASAALGKEWTEETFLKKEFPLFVTSLSKDEKSVLELFKRRKEFVKVEQRKDKLAKLTPDGEKLAAAGVGESNVVETLTPELLRSGQWRNKQFRRYDVTAMVPKISGGRRHFVNEAIDYIRKIWLDLGFTEMEGSMIQTSFWTLDTLFVPQDHPARDLQDTFYVKNPAKGTLPATALVKKIKAVHETGGATGSTGWGGVWSEEFASRNILRTHTTGLSAITLAKLKESDLPAKFFAVGRVFRNETLDWKHLFEFNQVEGIVVDPNANMRHLFGYLKEFYAKMGFTDIKLAPSYFPYTEPSVEVHVFHPVKKEWLEVGGAGIFRPEVTIALLGKDIPVLAWGQGMERVMTEYYKIADLRELYRNDVKQLRDIKAWTR
ncbi:phenylalanine--tRNA ligase subunit alpha [Candidatus Woesearchaeota archaeon]|nr:phenylalanine--tRNA ligase subunit alpha [Candidatus Woesearchaeota archaeon]